MKHRSAWKIEYLNEDGQCVHTLFRRNYTYTTSYGRRQGGEFKANKGVITLDQAHVLVAEHHTQTVIDMADSRDKNTTHWSKTAKRYELTKGHMDPSYKYDEYFIEGRHYGPFDLDSEEETVVTLVHAMEELQESALR